MWYGEYNHTLDDKDRFILPAKFREKITAFASKTFYITRGLDGCLFLFHYDEWMKLEEKLKALSFTKQQSRFFNRLYFSGAHEVEVDAQGRVSVPKHLKEYAMIHREIIIVGIADRIEVWDKEKWALFCREQGGKFEEVAEHLFE